VERNIDLFFALGGHAGANFVEKPTLEILVGLNCPAADDESVGIEGVDHLIEEQAERVSLNAEDFPAHGIALFSQAANQFGGLTEVADCCQLMMGITREEIREKSFTDGGERAQGFEIA
jgi:hypothetical protein